VGALYVARRDGDRLLYAGKIQIGLTLGLATELRTALEPLIQAKAALSLPVRKPKAIWLQPRSRQRSRIPTSPPTGC
jgi:bifunctional non-homologous end joining protein LigD